MTKTPGDLATTRRRLTAALAVVLWALAGAPLVGQAQEPPVRSEAMRLARDRLAVAMRFEIQEQFMAAQQAYHDALIVDPWSVVGQRLAGEHFLRRGMYREAGRAFAAMTRLDPYSDAGYGLLGMVEVLQGAGDDGLGHLAKGLEMDPSGVTVRLVLWRLAMASGDLRRARDLLDGIPGAEAEVREVVMAKAATELAGGQVKAAAMRLDKLVEQSGGDPVASLRAAELLLGFGACREAMPRLIREAKDRPRAESLRSLGWGLLVCGHEPIRAAGAFEAALSKDRHDDGAKVGLAWSLMAIGTPSALTLAGRYLDDVMARDPVHTGAALARAWVHILAGEHRAAGELLSKIPAHDPVYPLAMEAGAAMAVAMEDPYGAIQRLVAAMAARPRDLHLKADLVVAYVKAGQSRKAEELLDSMPQTDPVTQEARELMERARARRK